MLSSVRVVVVVVDVVVVVAAAAATAVCCCCVHLRKIHAAYSQNLFASPRARRLPPARHRVPVGQRLRHCLQRLSRCVVVMAFFCLHAHSTCSFSVLCVCARAVCVPCVCVVCNAVACPAQARPAPPLPRVLSRASFAVVWCVVPALVCSWLRCLCD